MEARTREWLAERARLQGEVRRVLALALALALAPTLALALALALALGLA